MATFLRKILGLALGIAGVMVPQHHAEARLSGVADVSYIRYDSSVNDKRDISATSLQQQYSLLYETTGVLVDGRLGRYKFSIGGEWAGYNTSIKDYNALLFNKDGEPLLDDKDVQKRGTRVIKPQPRRARHLLWDIDVAIDPREMPFTFRAYSRDMKRMSFDVDTVSEVQAVDPIIDPRIATNIFDGVHIVSGATLKLGVKNGMTNGYNTVFRDLPMILVDYRDEIHRDWGDQTPVDSRLERLAFVSLNKKDNWFHFRTTRFTDKISPDSSYRETQIQLGTVDQALVRRWIDLTNWIKISVDGQYTKRKDFSTEGFTEEQMELNLFGIATRRMWEAKTFNWFSRTVDTNGPLYERRIPITARGNIGLDTEWNLRTSYEDWQRVTGHKEDRTTMQASLRVDTFKRSPFTLANTISVEKHKSDGSDYISIDELIETNSTRRFSDRWSLYASYNIKGFSSDAVVTTIDEANGDILGTNTTSTPDGYVSQALRGRAIYRPSQLWKTEVEAAYSRTDGNPQAGIAQAATSNTKTTGQSFSHDGTLQEYSRYSLTTRTDWEPVQRLKFNLTASGDVLQIKDTPTDYLTIVGGSVDYTIAKLYVRLDTRYTLRWGGDEGRGYMLEQSGRLQYNPDRSMDAGITYRFFRGKDGRGDESGEDYSVSQTFNYYLYSTRGVARRVLEVNETAELSRSSIEKRKTLGIGLRYNVTKQLFIAGRARYSFLNRVSGEERELSYNGTIGVDFQKLHVALDYGYGRRDSEDKRIDKRLGVNVRKIF